MGNGEAIERLKEALRRLPGVGPRTAGRMAFHLLERDREGGKLLAQALHAAVADVNHCERCNNFSEHPLCDICKSGKRDENPFMCSRNPRRSRYYRAGRCIHRILFCADGASVTA